MGIQGLLPLLRSITDRVHLEQLEGKTVAVDAYSWLHKGVYGCAADLFHGRPTRGYVEFCVQRIRLLLHHRIRPVLVFDGGMLPAKRSREAERAASRASARERAEALLSEGRLAEASAILPKALDVTPEMAGELIRVLRRDGIDYIVAPYEADAQLAFLDRNGTVDAVISEDSDLLLFGCRRLCLKLDARTGYYDEIRLERVGLTREIDLRGITLCRLRQICILSGCDYLPSMSGMGLKTAHRYMVKYGTAERVLQVLRAENSGSRGKMPAGYEDDFVRAELTFSHQRVFDPQQGKVVCLSGRPTMENERIDPFLADDSFLGPLIPDELAEGIVRGDIHPITFEPLLSSKTSSASGVKASPIAAKQPIVRSPFFPTTQSGDQPQPCPKSNDQPQATEPCSTGCSQVFRDPPRPRNQHRMTVRRAYALSATLVVPEHALYFSSAPSSGERGKGRGMVRGKRTQPMPPGKDIRTFFRARPKTDPS